MVIKSHINFEFPDSRSSKETDYLLVPVDCTFILPKLGLSQAVFEFGTT